MKNDIQEQLSALMDGELDRDQTRFLLRRMENDADLRQQWARYHLIRDVFHRQAAPALKIFDRVTQAIQDEASPSIGLHHNKFRLIGGIALAASVAIAALFAVSPSSIRQDPIKVPTLAVNSSLRTSDLEPKLRAQPVAGRNSVLLGQSQAALDEYLIEHGSATASARGGFVPYVYIVATPTAQPEQAADNDSHSQPAQAKSE